MSADSLQDALILILVGILAGIMFQIANQVILEKV